MGLIAWIVVGAIAGFLANRLMGPRDALIMTLVLGTLGGLAGGLVATGLFSGSMNGIDIASTLLATLGALLLLFAANALQGGRILGTRPR